jgi:glycosyltransferase involved in cell wall biosynthesis
MKLVIMDANLNELGGAERVVIKIAQHYDAKIYALNYDPNLAYEEFSNLDVEVMKRAHGFRSVFPKKIGDVVYNCLSYYNTKLAEDYDVINAHGTSGAFIRHRNERVLWYVHEARLVNALGVKKPLFNSIFDEAVNRAFHTLQHELAVKNIEAIVANSNSTQKQLMKYFGRSGTVINPAVDYKEFRNGGDGKYFLHLSRIDPWKRQEYTIEAFSRFMKLANTSKYKLIIAGDATFPEYLDKLKSMHVKNVIFKQNISNLERVNLYANSTAVLFSTINEPFGIVPLEAMASEKPVISVNEGGPAETIVDGKTGFLVSSPQEMAERMKYIVEHESIAQAMGKAGRRRVIAKYSWEQFFKKFDPIARKVSRARGN